MKLMDLRLLWLVPQIQYSPDQIFSIGQNATATSEDSKYSATNQESTNLQDIKHTAAASIKDQESYVEDANPENVESLSSASLRNIENTEHKLWEVIPNQALDKAETLESSHMFMITDLRVSAKSQIPILNTKPRICSLTTVLWSSRC